MRDSDRVTNCPACGEPCVRCLAAPAEEPAPTECGNPECFDGWVPNTVNRLSDQMRCPDCAKEPAPTKCERLDCPNMGHPTDCADALSASESDDPPPDDS